MENIYLKKCSKCEIDKPLTRFYKRKRKSKKKGEYIYYHHKCIECTFNDERIQEKTIKEIIETSQKNEFLSYEIAKIIGIRHGNILKKINKLLERTPELKSEFSLSSYSVRNNQEQPCYIITKKALNLLENREKIEASLEKAFGKWLDTLFPNEIIHRQYSVLRYRVDFYFESLGICIEYDEHEHKYRKEKDFKRQKEIQDELKKNSIDKNKKFPFVRIKQGKEIEGVRELLLTVNAQSTSNDIFTYMK